MISVVIPTWNGGPLFREVLDRILSQEISEELEVVCVDSGSLDGTRETAEAAGAVVLPIDQREFNHGRARNLGIQAARGDPIALTVQDALPQDKRWLRGLVEALEAADRTAGSYARQIPREDCDPIIRDRLMHWAATRPERTVQGLAEGSSWESLDPWARLALIAFDNVSSCVRREVWRAFPFPDKNFGEDVAWAARVIQAGFRLVYAPESAVIHSHNHSVWYEFKRIYADHENLNRLTGLQTVPLFRDVFRNGAGAFRHYHSLIVNHEKTRGRRWLRTARALPYAFLENLAQYLGARLHKAVAARVGAAISLDAWLKHGI
jgi:rhamnosyltransferase